MPYKVLMVAPTSFFSDYGGHIRILEETLALQEIGHQVTIVTYYKGGDVPGLDIRRTPPLPYRPTYEVGSSRHKLAFDLYLSAQVLRTGLRLRPDIVHGHMHEGALIGWSLARLLGAPLVFDFQGSLTAEMLDHGFMRPGGKTYRLFRALEAFTNHRPEAILTSSQQVRRHLIEEFDVPAARIEPLPDCVDLARFDAARFSKEQKEALRHRWKIPADRPLVVYLGLLTAYQGLPHMLQAAKRLQQGGSPPHFLIMGFPNVELYKQQAAALGVDGIVTFTGKIPYDQAPLYLSLGDIAITAKMSATEGSGKLLNYMALGLPVVAYDTPVHREYLGEAGEYVPVGDIDGLASAIDHLIRDPQYRLRLGNTLRERVATHFTWQAAAGQIDRLYRRLCGE